MRCCWLINTSSRSPVRVKAMHKARASAKRPDGAITEEEHRLKMQSLEKERFEMIKEINDTEARRDYSAGELAQMKKELAEAQARDITQDVQLDNSA